MTTNALLDNFKQIYDALLRKMPRTNIARGMGYTTTTQLNSTLVGDSVLSTKAILAMIENLKVNPTFLFLGRGNMFLTEEDEIEQLNTQLKVCQTKH